MSIDVRCSMCGFYRLCWFMSFFCFVKQKTAYEMRISDWSLDVCSSDLSDQLYDRPAIGVGRSDCEQSVRAGARQGKPFGVHRHRGRRAQESVDRKSVV